MHILKCVAENFKVILAPSPKYTGIIDDPPLYMGEGFVVLSYGSAWYCTGNAAGIVRTGNAAVS